MAKARETTSIIGAGPVGLVAALYLAKRGARIALYEGRPDPRELRPPGGRSINLTIAARGWKAFTDVGAEAAVRAICLPLRARHIHHEDGSATIQPYGSNDECIYAVSRAQLTKTLIQLTEVEPNIRLNFGYRVVQLDAQTGLVEFERPERGTGVNLRAGTVLASDGAYSTVRASLLRHRADDYQQSYSRHWYKELRIPAGNDWALDPTCTHVWPRKDAILVAFPNLNRSFTATLFLPVEGSPSFRELRTREDLIALFRRMFPDILPLAPDLDFAFFSRAIAPLTSMSCSPWTWKGKYALIGDAAHSMVPFLGQGMNAGLEDCTVLDDCVGRFDMDWQSALADYEERRKPECDVVTALAEQHYQELAVGVEAPAFHLKKRLENRLHHEHPDRFIPLYTLVTFTCLPYSLGPTLAAQQDPLVNKLASIEGVEERWQSDLVQAVIREYVERTPPISLGDEAKHSRSEPPRSRRA